MKKPRYIRLYKAGSIVGYVDASGDETWYFDRHTGKWQRGPIEHDDTARLDVLPKMPPKSGKFLLQGD